MGGATARGRGQHSHPEYCTCSILRWLSVTKGVNNATSFKNTILPGVNNAKTLKVNS